MLSTQGVAVRGLVVVRIFLVKRVDLTRMIRPTYELYTQCVVMLTGVRKRKFDVGRSSVDITGLVLAKKKWKKNKIKELYNRHSRINSLAQQLDSHTGTTKKGNSERTPTSEDKPGRCHTQEAAVDSSSPYQ